MDPLGFKISDYIIWRKYGHELQSIVINKNLTVNFGHKSWLHILVPLIIDQSIFGGPIILSHTHFSGGSVWISNFFPLFLAIFFRFSLCQFCLRLASYSCRKQVPQNGAIQQAVARLLCGWKWVWSTQRPLCCCCCCCCCRGCKVCRGPGLKRKKLEGGWGGGGSASPPVRWSESKKHQGKKLKKEQAEIAYSKRQQKQKAAKAKSSKSIALLCFALLCLLCLLACLLACYLANLLTY